jgi:hypothetical protein
LAQRTAPGERQIALATCINTVGTELADCLIEAVNVEVTVPDEMAAHLVDMQIWANDVRHNRVRPHLVHEGMTLDEWLRELRDNPPTEALAPALPVPLAEQPWPPNPARWQWLRPTVVAWRVAVWWRSSSAHLRGEV